MSWAGWAKPPHGRGPLHLMGQLHKGFGDGPDQQELGGPSYTSYESGCKASLGYIVADMYSGHKTFPPLLIRFQCKSSRIIKNKLDATLNYVFRIYVIFSV
jgi:hypothetical protein